MRFLPTPPPNYVDKFSEKTIKIEKGIFPPSLKIVLKTHYHLPVRRPAPKISVQPDDVIGGHRAGENSPQSQCDPSPRRAAVDTGSEEPGTPPRSPAIGTGPGPGVSRAKTQMDEKSVFPFETSIDSFLCSNCSSTEQDYSLLHQPDVGVDDEKETTATSQQATVREEIASPTEKRQQQRTTAWATKQNKQCDRGR